VLYLRLPAAKSDAIASLLGLESFGFLWHSYAVPRKVNNLPTHTFTISTTGVVVENLERLVRTGYYGKNPAEAAERLLSKELERRFGAEAQEISG